ncbi:MAG: CPBP family intramembrane glutamic endopeptidase [candidate division FCPU426 bacterium]
MPNSLPPGSFRPAAAAAVFIGLLGLAGWWPVHVALTQGWEIGWNPDGRSALLVALMRFGPALAALFGLALSQGSLREGFGLAPGRPLYFLPAWFLLPLLAALAAALSVLLGLADWDWNMIASQSDVKLRWSVDKEMLNLAPQGWAVWLAEILLGPVVWFLPAWAEETAWRGLLFHWLRRRGFWVTALAGALLEWAWRFPLYRAGYAYPDHVGLAPWLGLGFTLLISLVLTWLRAASGAIWAPAIARATLSAGAVIPLALTKDYDSAWAHLQGLTGMGLLMLAVLAFWSLGWLKIEEPEKPAVGN